MAARITAAPVQSRIKSGRNVKSQDRLPNSGVRVVETQPMCVAAESPYMTSNVGVKDVKA
jgi:hypothetical protein